jgi:hypothetical protein
MEQRKEVVQMFEVQLDEGLHEVFVWERVRRVAGEIQKVLEGKPTSGYIVRGGKADC